MVCLLSPGDFYPHQRGTDRPSLGDLPPPPLAPKSGLTMLDSGDMAESEDKPPTLASLRARRGKLRAGKKPFPPPPNADSLSQAGLFSAMDEIAPVFDNQLAEAFTL